MLEQPVDERVLVARLLEAARLELVAELRLVELGDRRALRVGVVVGALGARLAREHAGEKRDADDARARVTDASPARGSARGAGRAARASAEAAAARGGPPEPEAEALLSVQMPPSAAQAWEVQEGQLGRSISQEEAAQIAARPPGEPQKQPSRQSITSTSSL